MKKVNMLKISVYQYYTSWSNCLYSNCWYSNCCYSNCWYSCILPDLFFLDTRHKGCQSADGNEFHKQNCFHGYFTRTFSPLDWVRTCLWSNLSLCIHACSTEVKSRPYPYFTLVFKTGETHPGSNSVWF